MTYSTEQMDQREQEVLKQMREMALPDSMEYMSKIPKAASYILKHQLAYQSAKLQGAKMSFDTNLNRYFNAWRRIWQKMALDLYDPNDVTEVDMQVYRHLPDGYSFRVYSRVLDTSFTVYPREPKDPKGKWITAGEIIMLLETPVMFEIMKEFPDTWLDRKPERAMMDVHRELAGERQKVTAKLKFKESKKGWDHYEEDNSYERKAFSRGLEEVGKKAEPECVRVQNQRLLQFRDT